MNTKLFLGKYSVARASALAQSELLSMLASTITARWVETREADDVALLGMCLSLPLPVKSKIHELVLNQAFHDGTETKVTIGSFQNKMIEYHSLLAECIKWNLEDFFTYIVNAREQASTSAGDNQE